MSSTFNHDKELAEFFTDVEHLRDWFNNSVAAPELARRLLVIHGVGGVGKSSLLKMFRLHCKSVNVPVALASGDDSKSVLDVLTHWTEDLKADGVAFPLFGKTYEHYRAIQAKVDTQAKKAAGGRAADIAGKAASKTAEAAGGALAGAAIGSVIPGVGTAIGGALGGVLGGMGAEALVDWMRGFLTKPDIDLLLDPTKKLTDDFLDDVTKIANKKRIVLMLDTFEQMTALDDWARDAAQRLHANVLLVIAGRALPNWNRAWDGFIADAQVEELKPMTEDVMRELIRRYYATMRGGQPNPTQVDAIIRFARGMPLIVTSAVQLWVKYGVEDFQSVKAEIVANLVDRLMEGVPKALIPALEAAAIVRWFDQPILRAVTGLADVRDVYNELRRFPFVRTRVEGLALHDAVREIMDENLRAQDSERHCELHERAAAYFEKRLEKATGEEAERLGLERLYHRVRANEEEGTKLFQEMAEELTRYRLVNRLRALLNDVNTYPLERENNKLWREYYGARLAHLQAGWRDAMLVYERVGQNEHAEKKLRAYALCDLGEVLCYREIRHQPNVVETAIRVSDTSLKIATELDKKLIANYRSQSDAYLNQGNWDKAFALLDVVRKFYQEQHDTYGEASVYRFIKTHSATRGDWQKMYFARKRGIEILPDEHRRSSLYTELIGSWVTAYAWTGRYNEAEQNAREAIEIARQNEEVDVRGLLRDLGLILAFQNKFLEADAYFKECEQLRIALRLPEVEKTTTLRFQAVAWLKEGKLDLAKLSLEEIFPILKRATYSLSFGESLTWFGLVYETDREVDQASKYYERSLAFRGRRYFECAALTGLVRVKHAQGDYAAIPPLLAEAEQLAQQYEYNDHLASLRLTQGMTTDKTERNGQPSGNLPSVNFDLSVVIGFFKQAMIYALRYNRFLLDEVLSGRPQGTPLRPIIPYCLERGQEGRQMLTALRDWWQTGVNDIGTPRPDTISPISEGITLLEAERIAREREPGDGSPQKSVVEQIERALAGQ